MIEANPKPTVADPDKNILPWNGCNANAVSMTGANETNSSLESIG